MMNASLFSGTGRRDVAAAMFVVLAAYLDAVS